MEIWVIVPIGQRREGKGGRGGGVGRAIGGVFGSGIVWILGAGS